MTHDIDVPARNATARKAVLVAFITLVLLAFRDNRFFVFLEYRWIASGLPGASSFFVGQDMLNARLVSTKISQEGSPRLCLRHLGHSAGDSVDHWPGGHHQRHRVDGGCQ